MLLNRTHILGLSCLFLGAVCILNSFSKCGTFFGTTIHLTQHSASFIVTVGMLLYLTYLLSSVLIFVFFGQLRALEFEHLQEKFWLTLMDMFLQLAMFRDDFGIRWIAFMGLLMFIKMFHWILADRVDFMDQFNTHGIDFHIRTLSLMSCLWFADFVGTIYAVDYNFRVGPTMMTVFAFEFFVMMVRLSAIFGKYVLHTIDLSSDRPWEEKSIYFFYIDLVQDFLKLVAFTLFFIFISSQFGIPLYAVRELFVTGSNFIQRCRDLYQYRRATADMETRYPTATREELDATDKVCIVCREELTLSNEPPAGEAPRPAEPVDSNNLPKKLPCGHLFHLRCLKSWLERQQVCPTCRRSVLDAPVVTQAPQGNTPPAVPGEQDGNPVLPAAASSSSASASADHIGSQSQLAETSIPPASGHPFGLKAGDISLGLDDQISLIPVGPVSSVFGRTVQPVDVYALSDEELKAYEGESREAAIARLEALRTIQGQLQTITSNLENVLQANTAEEVTRVLRPRKGKSPVY